MTDHEGGCELRVGQRPVCLLERPDDAFGMITPHQAP